MNDEKLQAPNWNVWRNKREARIWEAVALSLNIEPSAIPKRGAQRRPAYSCIDNFDDRLDVAVSRASELGPIPMSARGHFWDSRIALEKFADLADECAWSLDSNFPRGTPAGPVKPAAAGAPVATVSASAKKADAKPNGNWKNQIQAAAYEHWITLRASGANPTVHSILDRMANWCSQNDVKTDGGIHPSSGYLRTHVLGGKHWTPPKHSVEQAKRHVEQAAQVAQAEVAQVSQ